MIVGLFFFGAATFGLDAFALAGASLERKSTALVTPKVIAIPNIMSATRALFSPSSAFFVVGFFSKSLDCWSALIPKPVPTPAATIATAPVTYAGTLLRGSGGGGGVGFVAGG